MWGPWKALALGIGLQRGGAGGWGVGAEWRDLPASVFPEVDLKARLELLKNIKTYHFCNMSSLYTFVRVYGCMFACRYVPTYVCNGIYVMAHITYVMVCECM